MSIARTAVRIAAVRSILNRTLAGSRVSDSAIEPIDVTISEARLPIITVITDDDSIDGNGRDVWSGRREMDLVVEVAVATEVKDGAFTIPETDFGLEWALDIIEHQIDRALFDEGSEWSSIFMALVPRVHHKASRRGASAERGSRFAARQIIYKLDTLAAPMPGPVDATLPYGRLLAAMEADSELADYAAFLRTVIGTTEPAAWKQAADALGITKSEADGIGITPFDLTAAADVELAEVTVTGDQTYTIAPEPEEE